MDATEGERRGRLSQNPCTCMCKRKWRRTWKRGARRMEERRSSPPPYAHKRECKEEEEREGKNNFSPSDAHAHVHEEMREKHRGNKMRRKGRRGHEISPPSPYACTCSWGRVMDIMWPIS